MPRPFRTIGYGLGRSPLLGLFFLVVEIFNENGWFIRSPRSLRVFVQKRIATSDARYKRRLVIKFSTCIQVNIKGGMEAIRQYKNLCVYK